MNVFKKTASSAAILLCVFLMGCDMGEAAHEEIPTGADTKQNEQRDSKIQVRDDGEEYVQDKLSDSFRKLPPFVFTDEASRSLYSEQNDSDASGASDLVAGMLMEGSTGMKIWGNYIYYIDGRERTLCRTNITGEADEVILTDKVGAFAMFEDCIAVSLEKETGTGIYKYSHDGKEEKLICGYTGYEPVLLSAYGNYALYVPADGGTGLFAGGIVIALDLDSGESFFVGENLYMPVVADNRYLVYNNGRTSAIDMYTGEKLDVSPLYTLNPVFKDGYMYFWNTAEGSLCISMLNYKEILEKNAAADEKKLYCTGANASSGMYIDGLYMVEDKLFFKQNISSGEKEYYCLDTISGKIETIGA